ncbi:MAG: hypothetical protein P8172_13470 [Gammaproteobacteria bacterium]|jgi:hypothetical protein
MILALLAWYFLSGAGAGGGMILTSSDVDGLGEQAAMVIEDEARARTVAATLERLKEDVEEFEAVFAESGRELNGLYEDHVNNREEALAVLGDLNSAWDVSQKRALDARFALREMMTEEEWSAIFVKGW